MSCSSKEDQEPTPDVSVLIISYNTKDLTIACLESLYAETALARFEVIVVDNASSDGSARAIGERFPDVRLVEPGANLGFAKANNLAAKSARGRYLLLLNPDTVVLQGAVDTLVAFAEELKAPAIVGGRTLHTDGTLNHASCWGRPTLWSTLCYAFGLSVLGRYHVLFDPETMRTWKRDSVREVDIISGCLLLIPRTLWDALGGFDPAFDMYAEDFDLCLRARDMGVRCVLCPEGEIIHYGSASECVKADQLVRQMKAKTRLMRKHWGRLSSALGGVLLRMRVATRGYVGVIPFAANERRTGAAQAWREAWRRRREWLEL